MSKGEKVVMYSLVGISGFIAVYIMMQGFIQWTS
jgi:hypothetical protein